MDRLNEELYTELKFFEHRVSEWADVVKTLGRIVETLAEFPPGTPIVAFTELTERLGQCLNPELEEGIHLKALDVYEQLFRVFANDISGYIDDLFVPLLPLFEHASIEVKMKYLTVMDGVMALPIPDAYTAPLMASLLSARLAEGDDISKHVENILSQLEGRDVKYEEKLFEIASVKGAARSNALLSLSARDSLNEEYLYLILGVLQNGDDAEVRIGLDIVFRMCSFEIGNEIHCQSICERLIHLFSMDESVVRRIHEWVYAADAQLYSRVLLKCLIEHASTVPLTLEFIDGIFEEVSRKDEFLDIMIASIYYFLRNLWSNGKLNGSQEMKRILSYINQEMYFEVFFYREIASVFLYGRPVINENCMYERVPLTHDEILDLCDIIYCCNTGIAAQAGQRLEEEPIRENVLDVYGEKVYGIDSEMTSVEAEIFFILSSKLAEYNSFGTCTRFLRFMIQLLERCDREYLAEKLEHENWDVDGFNMVSPNFAPTFEMQILALLTNHPEFCFEKTFLQLIEKIGLISTRQFTLDPWFETLVQKLSEHSDLALERRSLVIDFFYEMLKSKTEAAKQIAVFFGKNLDIVRAVVILLFDQISPENHLSEDCLCKLCSLENCQVFSQALETYLASNVLCSDEKELELVRRFVLLWEHAAESYGENKLFEQILMLHIEMAEREDTEEEVRACIHSFIIACFNLDKWSISLVDAIFGIIEEGVKLKANSDGKLYLAKRTDKEYVCDIPRCIYVLKLLALLLELSQEAFIMALSEAHSSKLIGSLIKNDLFGENWENDNYLDYIIDFAVVFLIVQDVLDPRLLQQSAEFIDRMFQILKKTIVKSGSLLNTVNKIENKLGGIIINALINRPTNRFIERVILSILDAACSLINSADDLVLDIGICIDRRYIRLPLFIQELLKHKCVHTLLSNAFDADMGILEFLYHILDMLGVLQNDLSFSDVNTYCSGYEQFTMKRRSIADCNASMIKNLPGSLEHVKDTDKLENRMNKKCEEFIKRSKINSDVLDYDSLIPAPIRFLPAVFLSEEIVQELGVELAACEFGTMSLSETLLLTNLVYLCSTHIFIGYEQYEHLIVPLRYKTEERPKGMPSRAKDAQIGSYVEEANDLSVSFVIKPFIEILRLILKYNCLNDLSISEEIRNNIFNTVALIENYSSLLFLLTTAEIYTEDQTNTYPLILSSLPQALSAEKLLNATAEINYTYMQMFKHIEDNAELNFGYELFGLSSANVICNILIDTLTNFNFYSLLDLCLYRLMTGIDHEFSAGMRGAFIQLTNVLMSETSGFNPGNTNLLFNEPVYGNQLTMISQIKLLEGMSEILTANTLDTSFSNTDFEVVCEWIGHIVSTTFKAYLSILQEEAFESQIIFYEPNPERNVVQYISDTLFDCVSCLIQQFGREEREAHRPFLIVDQWAMLFLREKLELQQPTNYHADSTNFAPIIPILFNLLISFPHLKSRVMEMLLEFTNLDEEREIEVFEEPTIRFLAENNQIFAGEAVELISYNKYAEIAIKGYESLDQAVSDLMSEGKQKTHEHARTLLEAYCISLGNFGENVQTLLEKIMVKVRNIDREDDISLKASLLVVSASIYTLESHELQPMWTNIIELLSALYKRKIDGVAAVNWLLSQKFEDNSVYIRFMSIEKIEFQFWFYEELVGLWRSE